MPQGSAQAGDGDFRGVQAVVNGSIQEGKGCGVAGVGELFVCLWITLFLAAKSLCHQAKGLTVPLRPAPKRSYLDSGSSGKVLTQCPV